MSRNFTSFRVAFSQAPLKRKAHPAQDCNSGMRFPRIHIKEKDPFAEVLVNSRWRGRESRPRAARTDRCGACAPCELRWQTLSRFLSSAPSRGSIPCGGYIKEKDLFAEVLVNSRWRGRESRPRAARTDRCGACAPCELRWQTLSRFLSSAPSRGSIPCGDYIKEKDPFAEVLVNSRWRGRESNP